MAEKRYLEIIAQVESYLDQHGDTHLGVGWFKPEQVDARYRVMLDVIRPGHSSDVSVLDFGCGAAHLLEYITKTNRTGIRYSGLDLSQKFITLARRKYPDTEFYECDVLDKQTTLPVFDYVIMNGIFTQKVNLSFSEMFEYMEVLLTRIFPVARHGVAFNVMSKNVDWERDDLFHVPSDLLAALLVGKFSRHFVIRHDYGLYEYTVYLYHDSSG